MDDKYYQMTKACASDTEGLYNVSRLKHEVEMLCNELPLSEVASLLSDLQFFASCGSEAMDTHARLLCKKKVNINVFKEVFVIQTLLIFVFYKYAYGADSHRHS